jgi:hypothetical protein
VLDINNTVLPNQLVCEENIDDQCTLFFEANLTLHSFAYFKIRKANNQPVQKMSKLIFKDLETSKSFLFDDQNGIAISSNLENFTYMRNGQEFPFKLSYQHYLSRLNSGHYIIRPDENTRKGSKPYSKPYEALVFQGPLFTQITVFSTKSIFYLK